MRKGLCVSLLALALFAAPAAAHVGGKAKPKIDISSGSPSAWEREYTIKLTDSDGPDPVTGAEVVVSGVMREPHHMKVGPVGASPAEPGVYRAKVGFPMSARWEMVVDVKGATVEASRAPFVETIEVTTGKAKPRGPAKKVPEAAEARVELGSIPWPGVAVQVVHLILAIVWIGGHAFIALSLRPFLADVPVPHRQKLFAAVMRRYSLAATLSVAGILGTGVYNATYNVPAPLTKLAAQPLGDLYIGLLATKIGLLVVASAVGIYASTAIVPKLGPDDDTDPSTGQARRMFIASTVNLVLGLLIVTAAVAMRDLHLLMHGHGA